MEIRGALLVISATIFWTLAQTVGKKAVKNISPLSFNSIRFLVFLPLIFLFYTSTVKLKIPPVNILVLLFVLGIIAWCIGSQLVFYSLKKQPLQEISPLMNTYPLWALIFGIFLLRETPSLIILPSFLLIFLGINFICRFGGFGRAYLPLAAALAWGITIIGTKYCLNFVDPLGVVFFKSLGAISLFLVGWLIYFEKIDIKSLFYSMGSGFFLFCGEVLYTFGLKRIFASYASVLMNSQILFAFVFSIILLGEKPTINRTIGAVLILIGLIMISLTRS